jgi:hypothetical protein
VKCFYDAQEATGVCKNCGRGVCNDSAATVGKSLACKARCEEEVGVLNELFSRNRTIYKRNAGIYTRYAVVPGLLGVFSLGYALFQQDSLGSITSFYAGAGVLMLLAAGIALYNGRQFRKP